MGCGLVAGMSTRPIYKFQRGEPIIIGRRVLSGDPTGYTVTALLKQTRGQVLPPAETPVAAEFEVQFEAAAAGVGARWMMIIPGEVSADLQAGHYVVDARFAIDGEAAYITDPAFITLTESVSG